ncbi:MULTISPECIES: hypothetical protein [Streptomyces]|uniref:hypothetical protein n=1 Tax=Streptomyces TaxID=1883 RepID=UPI00226E4138|nr:MULTISPECIES: hypothetical protein [unclassified Streptomyces]MCY0947735.1 hypothetical protein [Streptomyces sp. H34-AA3]MCZ4088477.1 hypothetical protein [Streptomyces sp. H34-S5]MDJ0466992.1 hypothetical protein [Streptomyces sp. H27-C3]
MRKLIATPVVAALAFAGPLVPLGTFITSMFGVLIPAGAAPDAAFFFSLLVAVVAYALVKLPLPGARRPAIDAFMEAADRVADWAGFEYIPDPN